jgi:DNA-binding NarL/FixJ family response regulator
MNKIIIVDDHALFREGIKLLIENEGLGKVIAEAENGQSFLGILKTQQPDLVIMNMDMPMMNAVDTTLYALQMSPNLKVLVLSMLSDMANYLDILNAGALGIVLKTSGKKEFEKAIKTVLNGENYYSNEILNQIFENLNLKKTA